uniref:Uncharacterized protein n=1 Tax=Arundo donax TaxID=35708 RepID=A0A0A9HYK4_ARUDO
MLAKFYHAETLLLHFIGQFWCCQTFSKDWQCQQIVSHDVAKFWQENETENEKGMSKENFWKRKQMKVWSRYQIRVTSTLELGFKPKQCLNSQMCSGKHLYS